MYSYLPILAISSITSLYFVWTLFVFSSLQLSIINILHLIQHMSYPTEPTIHFAPARYPLSL